MHIQEQTHPTVFPDFIGTVKTTQTLQAAAAKLHEMSLWPLGREQRSITVLDDSVWQWELDVHILQQTICNSNISTTQAKLLMIKLTFQCPCKNLLPLAYSRITA